MEQMSGYGKTPFVYMELSINNVLKSMISTKKESISAKIRNISTTLLTDYLLDK